MYTCDEIANVKMYICLVLYIYIYYINYNKTCYDEQLRQSSNLKNQKLLEPNLIL